jgi:putative peptide zinc metalloprotease protein
MSQPVPRLRDDLKITLLEGSSTDIYVIEDPLRNNFYKIGGREYRFLCRLDSVGNGSASEVSEEEAMAILQWLGSKQLLQNQDEELMQELEANEQQMGKKSLLARLNLISFRIPLFNPDPFLDRFNRYLGWLAGAVFFVVWIGSAFVALGLLVTNWSQFLNQGTGFFAPLNLLLLTFIWIALKFLHELSHAITCKRYGGGVYELGVLFILFIPLTYVNASSSWSFSNRWQRIHVAVAGIYMELFVAWLAILYWATHLGSVGGMIAHNTVLIAGVSSLLFNANPLMRFDGYYVLSDLSSIPNLYFRGLAAVRTAAMRFWLGVEGDTKAEKQSLFVRGYGVGVYCWRILILFSLGYLASKMFSGWGLLLTMIAAVGWLYQPVAAFISKIPLYRAGNPKFQSHLIFRLLLVGSFMSVLLFGVSWRKTISIPAVVLFEEQYSIRAEISGFVKTILVAPGDQVRQGETLLLLENNELQSMTKVMQLEAQIMDVEERQAHVQRRYGALQILEERQKVLAAQQENVERDRTALEIVAPDTGIVVGENLASLVGTYVSKGQELFLVVKQEKKQLLASVSQDDVKVFLGKVGEKVVVDMKTSGLGEFAATIERVAPTASRKVLHFSLAANYGGPFDVKAATGTEQGLMLFTPHFAVTLHPPDGVRQALRSGQQAWVRISGTSQSPGRLLWKTIRSWFFGRQQSQ